MPSNLYDKEYDEPNLIYQAYYYQLQEIQQDKLHITWAWRRFFDLQTGVGRLLDIGCSTGAFMVAAKYRGFEPEGGDISAAVARTAHEATGCQIHVGMLEDQRFPSSSFDVVTSWEVLEHVPDPISFAREICRILRPNGVWSLSTPNWRSRWERVATDIPERRPPYHLVYWSPDPLRRLFGASGFTNPVIREKPIAWQEEVGAKKWAYLPVAVIRSFILNQKGNRLFGFASVMLR